MAETSGLLNRRTGYSRTEGSNPSVSASGPNLTHDVRKSYILQYAPDGALAYPGGTDEAVPQTDPARQ